MNTTSLAICYHPGARGDFLAAILCDTLDKSTIQNTKVSQPKAYLKLHSFENTVISDGVSLVYIKPESDLDLLYIAHYHILKNKTRDGDIGEWYDQYDMELKNVNQWVLAEHRKEPRVDYVIGFSKLGNPDALCDFYYTYHGEHIGTDKISLIKDNILIQEPINDLKIFKIFSLFVYEKEHNLLNYTRNFSLYDFLESNSSFSYCNPSCYNLNKVRNI